MKINIKRHKFDDKVGYEVTRMDYCCEEFKDFPIKELTNDFIEHEDPSMCISHQYEETCWEDSWETTDNYPINFCPFCGQPIEINVIQGEDFTEKYKQLKIEREQVWEKCRSTDSKRESSELQNQVHDIDEKINKHYGVTYSESVHNDPLYDLKYSDGI